MFSALLHAVFGLIRAHLTVVFGAVGFFWLLGSLKTVSRAGKTIVGIGIFFGVVGALWRRRRDVGQGIVVTTIAGTVALWALVLYLLPGYRVGFFLAATLVALFGLFWPAGLPWRWVPGGYVYERWGDKPFRDVFRDWFEGHQVREQVRAEAGDDATVGRPRRTERGWDTPVHLHDDPTTALNPHAIGGRLNHGATTVRDVQVTPHPEMGRATVSVSTEPAPPSQTPWERLHGLGARPWPGPYTSNPDAPIRIGFDQRGNGLTIPVPGTTQAGNVLVAGVTGAGKSATLSVMLAELAFRDDTALVLLDPDEVELDLWEPRASIVACGLDECIKTLDRLEALIERRRAKVKASGNRYWRTDLHGPRIIVVVDEYAAIPDAAKHGLDQWLGRARKFGGGTVVSTLRPERDVIPLRQRDNFATRIGLGMMSAQASQMAMTLSTADNVNCTDIPADLNGGMWLLAGRRIDAGRAYLLSPPGPLGPKDDPIELAARAIAKATAGLRIDPKDFA